MERNSHIRIADKPEIEKSKSASALLQAKSVIIDNQNHAEKKRERVRLIYIIKQGDNKRLNKDGIFRVYELNKPIEIPVTKLLGEWKPTHIGVTLACLYDEWQIEKGQDEHLMYKLNFFEFREDQSFSKFVFAIVKTMLFNSKPFVYCLLYFTHLYNYCSNFHKLKQYCTYIALVPFRRKSFFSQRGLRGKSIFYRLRICLTL